MRVLDKCFITPSLRHHGLLRLNADGFMMTRSLAENYPYTKLYKAMLRGGKTQWMEIVDQLELGLLDPEAALRQLVILMINRSEAFKNLGGDNIERYLPTHGIGTSRKTNCRLSQIIC